MTTRPSAAVASPWQRDRIVDASVVAGLLLAALGLVTGRPELVGVAAPLLLSAVWGGWRTPAETDDVAVASRAEATTVRSDGLEATLTVTAPADVRTVRVLAASPGTGRREVMIAVDGRREVVLGTPSVRTGVRELFTVDAIAVTDEGGWFRGPRRADPGHVLVLPDVRRLGGVPVSHQLRGLTGPHTSRRLGDGSEMRDVARFTSGDSVRRIDWRVTARRSPEVEHLYVRRTYASAEASVVLVLDSRDDVGPEIATWGALRQARPDQQTSLDLAREASGAIARAVVEAGDRVGFEDLGRLHSPLPSSGGKRHLDRMLHAIALARPYGAPRTRVRAPRIPAHALVYLFSTFLDDDARDAAHQWAASGHQVIAIDTLPVEDTWALTERDMYAWRLTSIAREDRLHALRASGITVLRWASDDPLAALGAVARASARGRRTGAQR